MPDLHSPSIFAIVGSAVVIAFTSLLGTLGFILRREVRRAEGVNARVEKIELHLAKMPNEDDMVWFRAEFRREFANFQAAVRHSQEAQIERIDQIMGRCLETHERSQRETWKMITDERELRARVDKARASNKGDGT